MRLALTPIVERLRGAGMRQVEGVLEFTTQTVEPRQLPARFVVPVSESAAGNSVDVGRDQAIDVSFSVFVVVDGARRNQAGIAEELKAEEDKVCEALVGWTHPAASRACSYAGGRLASVSGSTVTWEVRLRTRYHERKRS